MSDRRWWLLALAGAAACGPAAVTTDAGCEVPAVAGPISSARATAIAPDVTEGLAVSTTRIWGDCRPRSPGTTPRDGCGDALCLRGRVPLRVLLVPAGVSLPLSPACRTAAGEAGARVDEVAARAAAAVETSEAGEAVIGLPPGAYSPYLADSAGCARCGDPGEGICRVTVEAGRVALADLVLDEAAR